MPIPEGISVQERKRKRSAVVRWIMKRLSKAHMATYANLYVIQWRWGVRKDSESMTPWQTIMVKNKMYAILKHLLMPGRYYIFRVAAVNQFGSTGFSLPSSPFKLSKEVKAPSSPKNLTVESMLFDESLNRWIPKLTWIPPTSDLPIKDYQLSWWRSSTEFANAYEQRTGKQIPEAASAAQQSRRAATSAAASEDEDYSTIDESIEKSLRSSTIIPSYATKTQLIDGLDAERVYMVELFATVDSTEGELRGEPAVIFVRTTTKSLLNDAESVRYDIQPHESSQNDEQIPSTTTTPTTMPTESSPKLFTTTSVNPKLIIAKDNFEIFTTEDEDDEGIEGRNELDIRTPYFEASQLLTSISWLDSPACSPEKSIFAVRLTPKRCSQSDTRLLTVTQCIALIDGLEFDCEYEIEVDDVNARKVVSRAFFQTLPCDQTPATEALNCNYSEPTHPRCRVISATSTALCEWPIPPSDSSIIGYRTILSSPQSSAKIGVASTHSPRIQYDNLLPNADYRFRLQPVTNKGLSSPIDVEFSTKSSEVGSERRLDKFPILELPLESNSICFGYSNFVILTGLLFLRIFVN
uniref:Fibronectin type-III domain-containing protein n=1 Tax=Panagrolaimus superbus TaxID=310955 RepID=A0A914XSC0_9BILA